MIVLLITATRIVLPLLLASFVVVLDAYAADPTTFEIIGSSNRTIAMSAFQGGKVTFAITVRRINVNLTHVTSLAIDHPCFTRLSDVNRAHAFDGAGITLIRITYEPIGFTIAVDTLRLTDGVDTMDIILEGHNLSPVDTTKTDSVRLHLPPVSVLIGERFSIAPVVFGAMPMASSVNIVYSYPANTLVPVNAVNDTPDAFYVLRRTSSFYHEVANGQIATSLDFLAALGSTASPTITIREAIWRDSAGDTLAVYHIADTCFITIRDAVGIELLRSSPTALRVSPQPVNASTSRINVDVTTQYAIRSVDVFTQHGTLVHSSEISANISIDATMFPPGIYHVRVRTTHDVASAMFAVIR